MWQRFTERARKVVFYAQEEAQRFGEGYVSTEHLLLGLCREPDSTAARVLENMGASLSRIRAEVEKQLPRGQDRPTQDMTLTPRAKRVIDLAYDEARNLNNNYIGTEHLLLGLIKEGDGMAGRVLDKLKVDLARSRRAVIDIQLGNADVEDVVAQVPDSTLSFLSGIRRITRIPQQDDDARSGDLAITLLLGCFIEAESVSTKLSEELGVDCERFFNSLRYLWSVPARMYNFPSPTLSDYLKTADQLSKDPELLGSGEMTDVDLFLAVLKDGHTGIKALCAMFGLDFEKATEAVKSLRSRKE